MQFNIHAVVKGLAVILFENVIKKYGNLVAVDGFSYNIEKGNLLLS